MKKILYLCTMLGVWLITMLFTTPLQAQQEEGNEGGGEESYWKAESNPITVLEAVKENANKQKSNEVQNTDYDNTTSIYCKENINPRYTISRTFCNLKQNSRDYIQYAIFIGLSAATIFLIRNGFKIVTSSDREKELGMFKKNLLYIVIGVFLLIGFYYVIDIFVSVINAIVG